MIVFSEMKTMELWHYSLGSEQLISKLKDPELKRRGLNVWRRNSQEALLRRYFRKLQKDQENQSL